MKALIIYTSITNNTEMVAKTLGAEMEKYNITVDYAKVLPKYKGGEALYRSRRIRQRE